MKIMLERLLSHLEWNLWNERSLLKRAAFFNKDLSLVVEMTASKEIISLINTPKIISNSRYLFF